MLIVWVAMVRRITIEECIRPVIALDQILPFQVTTRFPCIYVIADGLKTIRRNNIDECRLSLMLLVGDKNYRGNTAAARGNSSRPGVYAMLEAIRDVLHRKKILTAWTPACLMSEEPQVYIPKKGLCLYSASYELQALRRL